MVNLASNELVLSKAEPCWQAHALVAMNLTIARGDSILCSQVDFSVSSGQILHVQGQNGIGKTTLLMILAGLLSTAKRDQGEKTLAWADQSASEWPVLYIGHLAGLNAGLSVRENLRFLQGLNAVSGVGLDMALDAVGLSGYEDIAVAHLSSGQKRRVSLARLWLTKDHDALWLLDEPFNSLDAAMTARLSKRLVQHTEGGGRVILTSHQALMIPVQTLDLAKFALQHVDDNYDCEIGW